MRVRTEDKRREIVAVAANLFEEFGFERTTMSLISQRVGGSKATLYGYFRSKEELLLAVLEYDIAEQADALMEQFLGAEDLRDGLIALGTGYLERRLASRPIANIRMVANQPAGSGIGKTFYEALLRPGWQRLADRFALLMDQGSLRRADPWIAAMHWKGMVEWDMPDRLLLGAMDAGDPDEIREAVVTGTDAFLRLYGAAAGDR